MFVEIMAKKGSILIVDDEEIMRDVLETILSAAGYKVDLAKTGEEALEAYARKSHDVVLMDVSMQLMRTVKRDATIGRSAIYGKYFPARSTALFTGKSGTDKEIAADDPLLPDILSERIY